MKSVFAIFTALLCMVFEVNAQSTLWAVNTQQPNSGFTSIASTATDSDGNVIMTGRFDNPTDFDPSPTSEVVLTSTGNVDVFIWKTSADGDFLWVKQIGGSLGQFVEDLAVDSEGSIYITGRMDGLTDFDPSDGIYELNATGGQGAGDIFIAKYSSDGDLVWAQRIGTGSAQSGKGIAVDNDGSVYVTGDFFGPLIDFDAGPGETLLSATFGTRDMFILKLSSDGTFQWVKKLNDYNQGSGNEFGRGVRVDPSGNLYLHGQFSGTAPVDFDPGSGAFELTPAPSLISTFVMKLDASGDFQWARLLDSNISLSKDAFALSATGDLFLGGSFVDTIDADPGVNSDEFTSFGSSDIFISRWSSAGIHVWTRQIGGLELDWASGLAVDSDDNVFFTGGFNDTVDFDPGNGEFSLSTLTSYNHGMICKLDSQGMFEWVVDFGAFNSYCAGINLLVDIDENLIMAGIFYGSIDFDLSPNSQSLLTSQGTQDRCLVKFSQCSPPTALGAIQGINAVCSGESVTYTVTDQQWADSYEWTLPGGWLGTSNTNSITLTAGASGGIISVSASNQCGEASPVSSLNASVTTISADVTLNANTLTSSQGSATWQWIDCNNNDAPVQGATGQSFTPLLTGSYAVVVTKNGCAETSACIEVVVTDVEEVDAQGVVAIHPNPAHDLL
ncbi:MAG: SBBP repeat-containing protein, partial [Flavobacteriales bacterium]|nr:SBBP repeat-containing protein [Flavobacteriales bacterium]